MMVIINRMTIMMILQCMLYFDRNMFSSFARRFSKIGNVLKFLSPEEIDDKFLDEKNLYKRDIITAALNLELFEEDLVSTSIIAKEIDKIAFLTYTGGAPVGRCASGYLPNLAQLLERAYLRNDLKVSILRAVSIIALSHPDSQAMCFEEGIFTVICDIIIRQSDSIQAWAIYCLYCIVFDNIPYLQIVREQKLVGSALKAAANRSWGGFSHNYASLILKVSGIERVKLNRRSDLLLGKVPIKDLSHASQDSLFGFRSSLNSQHKN